jgi:hypothetical protein
VHSGASSRQPGTKAIEKLQVIDLSACPVKSRLHLFLGFGQLRGRLICTVVFDNIRCDENGDPILEEIHQALQSKLDKIITTPLVKKSFFCPYC